MGPGTNGPNYLFGFGGCEDELHVGRWLLDDLEKCIEALRGDHVGLVEDKNLVAIASRSKDGALSQISRIVNTVVTGGINLNHIKRSRAASSKLDAAWALATWRIGGTLGAVEAPCQNPGAGGLATTPGPGKQIGVVHAVCLQSGNQGIGDLGLPNQLGKGFRAIAAIEGCGHPASLTRFQTRITRLSWMLKKGPLAHPPELSYPCYLSILGGLAKVTPREESPPFYALSALGEHPKLSGQTQNLLSTLESWWVRTIPHHTTGVLKVFDELLCPNDI